MKKILYLFFILIALFLFVFLLSIKNPRVCFGEECFFVEISNTGKELEKGLMNRTSLSQNRGMLFVFEVESTHSFWMKNMQIPIDIIWINASREVVHIEENVAPCVEDVCKTYSSPVDSKYVLEINAGQTSESNIEVGDVMESTGYKL